MAKYDLGANNPCKSASYRSSTPSRGTVGVGNVPATHSPSNIGRGGSLPFGGSVKVQSVDSLNAQRDQKTVMDHSSADSRRMGATQAPQGYRSAYNTQRGNQGEFRENVAGPFNHSSVTGDTNLFY